MKRLALSALFLASAMATLSARPATLQGTYVEARTSEVFAGACVINGEAATAGREALLAWKVDNGRFNGVPLDGLAVVAAVSGDANLSVHEIGGEVANTRTALFVDARATEAQRKALVAMVKTLAKPSRRHRRRSHASVDRVRRRRPRHSRRGEDGAAHGAEGDEPRRDVRKQAVVRAALDRAPRRDGDHGRERVQRQLARHEVERPEQALRVLRNVFLLTTQRSRWGQFAAPHSIQQRGPRSATPI